MGTCLQPLGHLVSCVAGTLGVDDLLGMISMFRALMLISLSSSFIVSCYGWLRMSEILVGIVAKRADRARRALPALLGGAG